MLVTFEPNVAQRSVASQNDHKSKACLPEASNTASTMYRCLKRRLRRLYEAPFLATFFLAPHSSSYVTDRGIQLTSFGPKNVTSLTGGSRPFRCLDFCPRREAANFCHPAIKYDPTSFVSIMVYKLYTIHCLLDEP